MSATPDHAALTALLRDADARHREFRAAGLALDLTRGKPATAQLDLSVALDGVLGGDYRAEDGTDVRNYGGLLGIPECRRLGGALLGVEPARVMAAGNSSLTLMYLFVETAHLFGLGDAPPWKDGGPARFLCPVPGYDRHFTVCESLGIEMVTVPMGEDGPDMDAVEAAVEADPSIKGIWCVPKYSNPTGAVYSDGVVERMAALPLKAGAGFRVLWDNAYAVHDLDDEPPQLADLMGAADEAGTADAMVLIGSTSKVSFAGAGVAFLATGAGTLTAFAERLGTMMIGWDKVNQLRHARLFPDMESIRAHMKRQAALIAPKFEIVEQALQAGLGNTGFADWTRPKGGYFVSVDTMPGVASDVVALAAEAGVKLTPAGSTWPYQREPEDRNIRLAPTFPSPEDVERAMEVFVNSVRLASARRLLADD